MNRIMRTNAKKTLKIALTLALCCALTLTAAACGGSHVCENCEKTFGGHAYYGMGGDEIMCEDCARSYWLPFDYRDYKWEKPPKQA